MDFNTKLQRYLAQPKAEREVLEGATLLLQMNRNRILYNNLVRRPEKFKEKLFYELDRYAKLYSIKVSEETSTAQLKASEEVSVKGEERIAKGKREDHDKLPQEIQQLWVENGELRAKRRSFHERAKSATSECDRIEAVTLLIESDKKYLTNWEQYDGYILSVEDKKTANDEQRVEESKDKEELLAIEIDARRVSANRKYLSANKEKLRELRQAEDQTEYVKLLKKMQERYNELESSGNSVSDEQKEELGSLGVVL